MNLLSPDHRRLLGSGCLLLVGLSLLLAAVTVPTRVRDSMQATHRTLHDDGEVLAVALDHELDIHVYNVMAMRYLAEQYLTGQARGMADRRGLLVPAPEPNHYMSVVPESVYAPNEIGRITGFGPVPTEDSPLIDEMIMAVGLTPIMRAIRARSPDVPWVKYTSASGFMYLFPELGADKFLFRRELLQRNYMIRAAPKANPERRVFWSETYTEAVRGTTIVTVTQPIYAGDEFKGGVSIDVAVSSLQRLLDARPLADTRTYLVMGDGRRIASAMPASSTSEAAPDDVIGIPLRSAPWKIELHVDRRAVLVAALRERTPHIAAVIVLALTLVFLVLLIRSARKIRELAIRDGLTGLYNRRYFDTLSSAQFALARRGPMLLGLAVLDVDFFKKYNDRYGHQQGDHALRAVAQALKGVLRRGSDEVFRVGGEEFAVLFALRDHAELEPLMHKLNQAVRDLGMPHAANSSGRVTVSIGATCIGPDRWLSVDEAYAEADEALYRAKASGRDCTVVAPLSSFEAHASAVQVGA